MPKYVPMSVEHISHMGSDINVVNAARVSFAKEVKEIESRDCKLLKYLADHNHWSPFAHTSISLRCKAPIFLARQLVKHQVGGNWNEESRRYIDSEPEFWAPEKWRGKPVNAKQGSSDVDMTDVTVAEWGRGCTETPGTLLDFHVSHSLSDYKDMISAGVAPEQARIILPLNTMVNWIWTGSVAFFARVYNQRAGVGAQEEAREFAERLSLVVKNCYPESWLVLTGEY